MEMVHAYELLGSYTAEQWGMVTTRQAKSLGVDPVTLHRLVKARFLEPVRRGVYAATAAAISAAREEQAVWLALNPSTPGWSRPLIDPDGGVISHGTAAHLHGLGELVNARITLTVPRRRDVRDREVRTKVGALADADVTTLDGLPVTTVLRTVCDLFAQQTDASHMAAIIRDGVETGQLRLDELSDAVAPWARLYGCRPNDGEGLIERVLSQIGLSPADLALRPASAHTTLEAAIANLIPSIAESARISFAKQHKSRLAALKTALPFREINDEVAKILSQINAVNLPSIDSLLARQVSIPTPPPSEWPHERKTPAQQDD